MGRRAVKYYCKKERNKNMDNRLTYSIDNLTQHRHFCTFSVSDDHRLTTQEIVDNRRSNGADVPTDCFYQITITKGDMSQGAYLISNGKQFFKYAESDKLQKHPTIVSIGTDVPSCVKVCGNDKHNRFHYIIEDVFRNTTIYDFYAPTKIALTKVIDSMKVNNADVKPRSLYKLTTTYNNKSYYFKTNKDSEIIYEPYTQEEIDWSGCGHGHGVALANPKVGTIYHFEAYRDGNDRRFKRNKLAEWNTLNVWIGGLSLFYLTRKLLYPNSKFIVHYASQEKNELVSYVDFVKAKEDGDVETSF